ncbi:MAG TPA: hypothetical protein VKW76_14220 [Candidatus Binatia bacterium]|nr:hypothetical protein [Candidatus Binatia bacterium]
MQRVLLGFLFVALGTGAVRAACTPFGGDDSGCLTTSKAAASCEEKIAGNVATKLVLGIAKCHAKQVSDAFKAVAKSTTSTFDEESCEDTAVSKFTSVSSTASCPCVNTATIASAARAMLDSNNSLVFCDPAGPSIASVDVGDTSGDDTGHVPSTKAILGCEAKLGKCVTLLVKGYAKCHQLAQKAAVNGKTFDEDGCETTDPKGPAQAYTKCVGSLTGCQGCEVANEPTIAADVDAALDGSNGLVFCESPSGAFLDGAR